MATNASAVPNLNLIPGVPPPPGSTFNPNDPDNYKHADIIMHSVVLSIVTVCVMIRLYTRAVVKKGMGADDCK